MKKNQKNKNNYYKLAVKRYKHQIKQAKQRQKQKEADNLNKYIIEQLKQEHQDTRQAIHMRHLDKQARDKTTATLLNTFIGIGAFMIILLILLLFGWALSKQ